MPRDYYDVLEVSRNAEPEAIKKAYRRLAKRYHPDVNKADEATERFREVQEAYDVLSDPKKRKLYDQFGHAGVSMADQPGGGPAGGSGFGGFQDFGDFRGRGRQTNAGPGGFSFQFNQGEAGDMGDIFEQVFGARGRGFAARDPASGFTGAGPRARTRARPQRGQDLEHAITVPFDTAARGGTVSMKLTGPNGAQTIDVKIPKAVAHGARLRVRGKGHPSPTGGQAGDLILTVRIADHPYFTRDGLNLQVDVPISLDEAVFGTTVDVPTLNGKAKLKITPRTAGGQRLRLRAAGLENTKGEKGDLYARIRIDVPRNLSAEQEKLLAQLKGQLPNPRRDVQW